MNKIGFDFNNRIYLCILLHCVLVANDLECFLRLVKNYYCQFLLSTVKLKDKL